MGIGSALKDIWRYHKIRSTLEKEARMGWDWKKSLEKLLTGIGKSFLAVGGVAFLAYLDDPTVLTAILSGADVPQKAVVLLVPLLHGLLDGLQNAYKHRSAPPDVPELPR